MKINTLYLIKLIEKYKEYLSLDIMNPLFSTKKGDCTNIPDCVLLYLLILENKPRNIVEFSPMHGFSTRYLATAMKHLKNKNSMFTVDINNGNVTKTKNRLDSLNLSEYCQVFRGDAINIAKKQIASRGWEQKVDLIFIDSDHSYQFGKKYIKEIFPLLSSNCIIMVHDICGENEQTGPYDLNFRTSLRSLDEKYSEYRAVKEFLIEEKIEHTLTHPLFGGHWESCEWRNNGNEVSPNLTENKEFYNNYKKIVGYDLNTYRNFQHPNGLVFQL